jgi:hypothetical protein
MNPVCLAVAVNLKPLVARRIVLSSDVRGTATNCRWRNLLHTGVAIMN